MPDIKLPDGKKIPFSKTIDGFEIANKISKSIAKDACIMSIDGELKDLSFVINKSAKVKIITSKDKEGLEVIRHDAAHVLAMSVQELFPGTQVTIGPVIKDGFYDDFSRKALKEREGALLPPYSFIALLKASSQKITLCQTFLQKLKSYFDGNKNINIYGPIPAPRIKKNNMYYFQLMIKSSNRKLLLQKSQEIREYIVGKNV